MRGRAGNGRDYRRNHLRRERAESYERLYGPGSYHDWLWKLEKEILRRELDRHLQAPVHRYLDFACGTGRVAQFLEERVDQSVGIDISPVMLEKARKKLRKTTLILGDVTTQPGLVEGEFDLLTAFRFFLNAQPQLRVNALRFLRSVIAPRGLLVFNVHGNFLSLRLPGYLVKRTLPGHLTPRTWPARRISQTLEQQGFEIVERTGYGFLPRRLHEYGSTRVQRIDEALSGIGFADGLAINLMFVCRPG